MNFNGVVIDTAIVTPIVDDHSHGVTVIPPDVVIPPTVAVKTFLMCAIDSVNARLCFWETTDETSMPTVTTPISVIGDLVKFSIVREWVA